MALSDFSPYVCHFGRDRPYEREYEGWVMRGVEDYFRELGIGFEYMAVSSRVENLEGLDQFMRVEGKYLGLQFKRPDLYSQGGYPDNLLGLKWGLEGGLKNPKGQFCVVHECQNIFYALPTFINRNLRRVCLSHVFFWRKDLNDGERLYLSKSGKRLLFPVSAGPDNNMSAATQLSKFEIIREDTKTHAYRWGRLAERLLACNVGAVTDDDKKGLKEALRALVDRRDGKKISRKEVVFILLRLHH